MRELTYFKQNGIRISKICAAVGVNAAFITTENTLYACGYNNFDKLGIGLHGGNICEDGTFAGEFINIHPILVPNIMM